MFFEIMQRTHANKIADFPKFCSLGVMDFRDFRRS